MADITMDAKLFQERITHLVNAWKSDKRSGNTVFHDVSSMVIIMGKVEDVPEYYKNNAVHHWLLGYEFPTTLMVLTTEVIYILTTAKKAKHLAPLKGGRFPLEVLVRGKDAGENKKALTKMTDVIKKAGNKVGVLTKDTSKGPLVDEWKAHFAETCKGLNEVDVAQALSSAAFSIKDEAELRAMRSSSKACAALMNPFFLEEMSTIIDAEKKVKHNTIADKIDKKLDDEKWWKSVQLPSGQKMPANFDPTQLDWTVGPAVQSGGKYDLRMPENNSDTLHPGVIIAAMGLKYKSYCGNIGRTFLVDPNKSQEATYKLLHSVHNLVLKEIRDGAVAREIYSKAVGLIKAKKPEMEKHFLKSVGYGIGIETKDNTLVLNAKNSRVLKDGMTLCINTGFNDVINPQPQDKLSKKYSLIITDTVRVTASDPVVFTGEVPTDADANFFFFKDEEDAQPTPKKEKKDPKVGAVATKNITNTRLRSERNQQSVDDETDKKRKAHQKELTEKKQREGLARFSESTSGKKGGEVKKFKKFESYKRETQFPTRCKDLSIVVDVKNHTVIVPVMGRPVPFHINTIKNASKSDEGDWAFLRINFLSPGQGVGRKDDQPFEDPNAHFVRSLTFRSLEGHRYQEISTQIANMKKEAIKKEQVKKDMEDVVEQDKLIEIRNRRPQVLDNIFIRPALEGKRVAGKLEIHQNGIRYVSPLSTQQRVDILFSNIRHLFFQPCQHELIVIIHVHLKDPIIVGNKKKTKDVQFYREATDITFDETGNRKRKYRYGDEDEFEAEQEERRRRLEIDKQFKAFAEKIADAGRSESLEVDMPLRDLGFNGVPFRSNVYIQPTTECLIQITEPPFMVLTLEDIEVAHLERVQFGLKNFDLVFVFKDFARAPYHINTIPVESLEDVKEFLDSSDIAFTDGPLNLNWPTIMKTVTADPHQFFLDGGWTFLGSGSDDEDGEDSDEQESAFEISDSDLDDFSESSEEGSDFDSNASDEASDDADDSDEEEGEDWDELERKAKKRDREGGLPDDESDRGRNKKRRK